MIDEGPSPEDIRRFGGDEDDGRDISWCPNCGAEIWHDASVCPECLQPTFGGDQTSRGSRNSFFQNRLTAVIIFLTVAIIVAFGVFQCSP